MIDGHIGGANLNRRVLAPGLDDLLGLQGLGVNHEELAAGALGHIQLVAVDGHIHADVAGAAVGCTLQLNLGDLEGFHVDSRDVVAAGHEHLARCVIHANLAGVLNPVRIGLGHAVTGPNLLHGLLVEHGEGVVGRVGDPHGTVGVIDGDAVRRNVAELAVCVIFEGKDSYFFNLHGVCIDTRDGGGQVATATHANHPDLVVRLRVGHLVLTGQALSNLGGGCGDIYDAAFSAFCVGGGSGLGRGRLRGVLRCEGGRNHGRAGNGEREGASNDTLQRLTRRRSEVQCVSL